MKTFKWYPVKPPEIDPDTCDNISDRIYWGALWSKYYEDASKYAQHKMNNLDKFIGIILIGLLIFTVLSLILRFLF